MSIECDAATGGPGVLLALAKRKARRLIERQSNQSDRRGQRLSTTKKVTRRSA